MKILYSLTSPKRIDKFLVEVTDYSRTSIKKMLEQNLVLVNDNIITKQSYLLQKNDSVEIKNEQCVIDSQKELLPFACPLEIVFEDQDLLVINKPSGMLVHPTSFQEQNTLANALKHYLKTDDFYITHRLDKNTSGLIVICKNQKALCCLQQQFMQKTVKKSYYAIVHNRFDMHHLHFMINEPIGHSYQDKLRMKTGDAKNVKEAISIVKVIEQYQNTALVEVSIITGRTHQIRVHMRHINHPIYNDPLYGISKHTTPYEQYLHSFYISFIHPSTNEIVEFKTLMPNEFINLIKEWKTNE
ncbi:RluA [Ureaplasma urealyticum serovar 10 str. ATCC 33699]|uniref:Pseudouridine synthase n=2 Tax=Ureaplasma urealyticum TaxID=2130 RepID=A0AAX1QZW3_UREUR|nr:RluA family pseudouridine synthase [Ureaplasma urealyticum]ACI60097.1 RluA [Ureaplasma urealyticum serovar 10 str. ATCC 33699]QDI63675.1 RluA family pseudouridine synthase [Ureaplasma urealyticum]RCJ01474.1 RluA family pseudouridine synthase [Ureaplasma urealyticum]